MIDLLEEYIPDSLPHGQMFSTNPNLRMKVGENREYLPFYGNTVVFTLEEAAIEALTGLQKELYDAAGWMLARPLRPDTFHMTLHDLVNSPNPDEDLRSRMAGVEPGAKDLLAQWKHRTPLRMKATWLFNMVNTSIVLGLAPKDGESRRELEEMYRQLETVLPLNRPLTPHITMAYFCPGTYFAYEVDRLRKGLRSVELELTLPMENLVFQNFSDMNRYMQTPLPGWED